MEIEYEHDDEREVRNGEEEEAEGSMDVRNNGDEEEQEEEETVEQADEPKKKRIIKARQSLAEKTTGTTIFPISRVKRIVKADKDLDMMTSEATFLVSVATEYFIKHFMEEGYTKARLDKRRIVNYKDMAAVVARSPEFEFLRDVVPTPIQLSTALQLRKEKLAADDNPDDETDDQPDTAPSAISDQLPPLSISTNPLYPNAIVKRPANTHAKTAQSKPEPEVEVEAEAEEEAEAEVEAEKPEKPEAIEEPVEVESKPAPAPAPPARTTQPTPSSQKHAKVPVTPKVATGKHAPTTPHSLSTRRSSRRQSHAAPAVEEPEADAMDQD